MKTAESLRHDLRQVNAQSGCPATGRMFPAFQLRVSLRT
jgi:hypothetical protein